MWHLLISIDHNNLVDICTFQVDDNIDPRINDKCKNVSLLRFILPHFYSLVGDYNSYYGI